MTNHNSEQIVTVLIAEYQEIREEIQKALDNQQQTFILIAGTAGAIAPLIIGQSNPAIPSSTSLLLYSLVIVLLAFSMNYAYNAYIIVALGCYLRDELGPRINHVININDDSGGTKLLQWESYISKQRATSPDKYLAGLSAVGAFILMVGPSLLILLIADSLLKVQQNYQEGYEWIGVLAPWIQSLGWLSFLLNILIIFAILYFNFKKAEVATPIRKP